MLRRRWTPAPSTTGSGVTTWATGRDEWLMRYLPALGMRRRPEALQAYAPGARAATTQRPTVVGLSTPVSGRYCSPAMKRLIAVAVLLAACLLVARLGADAQPAGKMPRIGIVSGDDPGNSPCVDALLRGLGELGYVEGKTHTLELRWSEGRPDAFPALAADLVRLKVDLIVSAAGPAAPAVKEATSTIPIVLASSFYPVESGIIASLARPGGNVTGVTHFTPELMAKRVQLLKEMVPGASRFAVLRLPGHMQDLIVKDLESAARRLGIRLQVIEVRRDEDLTRAFEAADAGRAQGVMSTQAPLFVHNNAPIARLALKHRLPSLSGEPGAAEAGTLLFYG